MQEELAKLSLVQKYMMKGPILFDDELFSLLYRDIDRLGQLKANELFKHSRRISFYGVRGVGKSTAMQGILWYGLVNKELSNPLPIYVTVKGASSVTGLKELQDVFYRSVITGVIKSMALTKREEDLKKSITKYAPWVSRKITEAAGLILPAVALASDIAEKSVKWLLDKLGFSTVEHFITASTTDMQQAADVLVARLEEKNTSPVFIIDELDKARDDYIISDFFDGNQAWFEHKRVAISVSYTFGEVAQKSVIASLRRIASIELLKGIDSFEEAYDLISARAIVGVSRITKDEKDAKELVDKILPLETIKEIVNISAPITYLILERTYNAIENAIRSNSNVVLPDHVIMEKSEEETPTELELLVLAELEKGKMTPIELAERLKKHKSSISRVLSHMLTKDWVARTGSGKRAYYALTARGLSSLTRATISKT